MIYLKSLQVTRDVNTHIIRATSCVLGARGYFLCVDFRERGKPEYPEKNPRITGEIKYEKLNSHETQTRPGLAFSEVRGTTR